MSSLRASRGRVRDSRAAGVLFVLAAVGVAPGCKPRTQLVVHFDSDLTEQQLPDIRLRCAYDWNGRTDIDVLSCSGQWHRGSSTAEISLPASFGVLPDDNRPNDPVTLVLDDGEGPLQRILQVPFESGHTAHVFVYLRAACRATVSASATSPCPIGQTSCTLSESCEEQGLTCGNDGLCRNVTVSTRELVLDEPDANGFGDLDAGTGVDTGVDSGTDSGARESGSLDTGVAEGGSTDGGSGDSGGGDGGSVDGGGGG